jgi:hypothetical protein
MNRKVTVQVLCATAAVAFSAVVATLASATTMTLPTFNVGNGTAFTGKSGKVELTVQGTGSVKCMSSTSANEITANKREGTSTLTFKECTEAGMGQECRSLGDALATILATAQWHLVLRTISGVDDHLFLYVLPAAGLHIECPKGAIELFLAFGEVLGLIKQEAGSTKNFTLKINVPAANLQEYSEYENDSGALVKVSLKVGIEGNPNLKPSVLNVESSVLEFVPVTTIEN